MKLIDISRNLFEAPKYPTAPDTTFAHVGRLKDGDESNFHLYFSNTHAGTHADADSHFVPDGDGICDMPLEQYYGPIRVITVPEHSLLNKEDLLGRVEGAERIALHGGGFTYLTKSAADYLIECGCRCLVTDAWSPAPLDNETEIHRTLLSHHVGIIENVTLERVEDGDYQLIAFPVNYGHVDGAPVRAVLVAED